MSELSHEVEQILHGKMKDENIRLIAEMVDFMKFKEDQILWATIDSEEAEETTVAELEELHRIKLEGSFSPMEQVIERLNRVQDEQVIKIAPRGEVYK